MGINFYETDNGSAGLNIGDLSNVDGDKLFDLMLDIRYNYGPSGIPVTLNSRGGEFSIYQNIYNEAVGRAGELFQSTEIVGDCGSTAFLLFMLSEKRIVNELSTLMIHPISYSDTNTAKDQMYRREIVFLNVKVFEGYVDKGYVSKEEHSMLTYVRDTVPYDIYLLPQDAMDRGIATHMRHRGKLYDRDEWREFNKK